MDPRVMKIGTVRSPSVEEDASHKGKKEGNGESWPVAAVVEVANDEWRHGRTLIRALGSATH